MPRCIPSPKKSTKPGNALARSAIVHRRGILRQRARRLQAGQRQAHPEDPQELPGLHRQQARHGAQAGQLCLPRRLRLREGEDRGSDLLRRRENEHRHRHPVRLREARRQVRRGSTRRPSSNQIDPDDGTPFKKLYEPREVPAAGRAGHRRRACRKPGEDLGSKGRSIPSDHYPALGVEDGPDLVQDRMNRDVSLSSRMVHGVSEWQGCGPWLRRFYQLIHYLDFAELCDALMPLVQTLQSADLHPPSRAWNEGCRCRPEPGIANRTSVAEHDARRRPAGDPAAIHPPQPATPTRSPKSTSYPFRRPACRATQRP